MSPGFYSLIMNHPEWSQDQRYIYGVGRIRALERYLLSLNALERLIEADSFSASLQHLSEFKGYEAFMDKNNLEEAESLLLNEEEKNLITVNEIAKDREIKELISLENKGFKRERLTQVYRELITADFKFLVGYLRHRLDWINIILYLRIKEYIRKAELLKDNFFAGGFVPAAIYSKGLTAATADFLKELSRYGYVLPSSIDLSLAEKYAEDFLMRFLKPAKYEGFGYEPLFGYFVGKQREVKNLRLILFGKYYNLPAEAIRGNLREPYV